MGCNLNRNSKFLTKWLCVSKNEDELLNACTLLFKLTFRPRLHCFDSTPIYQEPKFEKYSCSMNQWVFSSKVGSVSKLITRQIYGLKQNSLVLYHANRERVRISVYTQNHATRSVNHRTSQTKRPDISVMAQFHLNGTRCILKSVFDRFVEKLQQDKVILWRAVADGRMQISFKAIAWGKTRVTSSQLSAG